MTFQRTGGLAALTCAATYLFGFAFLITLLAPLGFGTGDINAQAVVAFIDARPNLLILWNTVIYILNALALTVLVVVVHALQSSSKPDWAAVTRALGLLTGAGGLLTLIPAFGDVAGAVFGFGAIAWFIAIGLTLIFKSDQANVQASTVA